MLVGELAKLTSTPSTCYFTIWDGDGILHPGASTIVQEFANDVDSDEHNGDSLGSRLSAWQRQVAKLPRVEHPNQEYLLGSGPIGLACDLDSHPLAPGSWQTLGLPPQLWWPEGRAWVVASEIDFDSSLVATTTAGADALIACDGLEALLVASDGRLDINGDEINAD